MNGILLVDKPAGMTSQNVISRIKHALHLSKIGHAGTLDPLATGLLVVLTNDATKLSDYIMGHDKAYEVRIALGKSTDTEDASGVVLNSKPVTHLSEVDSVLIGLQGPLMQVPPMYSSVHHQGKKLYEYAHKGIEVERVARSVQIYDCYRTSEVVLNQNEAEFSFIAKVSKGTYIRTLCVEIGNRLEYPAYMKDLRRIQSGKWTIGQAFTLDDILEGHYKLLPMIDAFHDEIIYEVSGDSLDDVLHGRPLLAPIPQVSPEVKQIVIAHQGDLLGVYEKHENSYKARRIWNV